MYRPDDLFKESLYIRNFAVMSRICICTIYMRSLVSIVCGLKVAHNRQVSS